MTYDVASRSLSSIAVSCFTHLFEVNEVATDDKMVQ